MNAMSANAMKAQILEMTGEHVDQLHAMWSHLFEPKTVGEFLHRLNDQAHSFFTDLMNESREKQQAILGDIADLRAEATDLQRLLHESVEIGDRPDDVPLVLWQLKLDKSIEHLRKELGRRRAEICELLLQQEQLCEELGELPKPLLADPLPLPEEMDAFRDRLEQLRDQRVLRLKDMQKSLADQVKELRERIDDLREKIHVLWDRLQETDEYAMRRVRESTSYTQRTYDVLREELQRCQALRRQNLKTFIEQLRLEIKEWWDLTLKSTQERKRFSNYYNDCYNEDLLELHEQELDDLKTFYNKNKDIFDLYESRAELWARMEALEAKANDPNRFNNRGGQLLKEEKERKAITSKLPKIEQQITELVQAYEAQENTAFLVHGENILELMAAEWERHHQTKQQNSARKKAPASASKIMPPPAPGSMAPRTPRTLRNTSALSSSTMSLRKTPSQQYLRPLNITKSTGNLHSRLNPSSQQTDLRTSNAKRSLMNTLNSIKASPARRLLTASQHQSQLKSTKSSLKRVRVLDNTLRRSGGMGRRSMGTRSSKKPRTKSTDQNAPTDTDTDYATDENAEHGVSYDEFQPMQPRQRHLLAVPRERRPEVNANRPVPRDSLLVWQSRRKF